MARKKKKNRGYEGRDNASTLIQVENQLNALTPNDDVYLDAWGNEIPLEDTELYHYYYDAYKSPDEVLFEDAEDLELERQNIYKAYGEKKIDLSEFTASMMELDNQYRTRLGPTLTNQGITPTAVPGVVVSSAPGSNITTTTHGQDTTQIDQTEINKMINQIGTEEIWPEILASLESFDDIDDKIDYLREGTFIKSGDNSISVQDAIGLSESVKDSLSGYMINALATTGVDSTSGGKYRLSGTYSNEQVFGFIEEVKLHQRALKRTVYDFMERHGKLGEFKDLSRSEFVKNISFDVAMQNWANLRDAHNTYATNLQADFDKAVVEYNQAVDDYSGANILGFGRFFRPQKEIHHPATSYKNADGEIVAVPERTEVIQEGRSWGLNNLADFVAGGLIGIVHDWYNPEWNDLYHAYDMLYNPDSSDAVRSGSFGSWRINNLLADVHSLESQIESYDESAYATEMQAKVKVINQKMTKLKEYQKIISRGDYDELIDRDLVPTPIEDEDIWDYYNLGLERLELDKKVKDPR